MSHKNISTKKKIRKQNSTGKMAQHIRAVVALLAEDKGLVPCTNMATLIWNYSSRGPDTFFWPPWALNAYVTQIHAGKTFINIK